MADRIVELTDQVASLQSSIRALAQDLSIINSAEVSLTQSETSGKI